MDTASAYLHWPSRQDKRCLFPSTLVRTRVRISRCHSQDIRFRYRRVWAYFEESYQSSVRLSIWLNGQSLRWVICRYATANILRHEQQFALTICSSNSGMSSTITIFLPLYEVMSVLFCFLPGDNQLISSSRDNTVRVWDVDRSCLNIPFSGSAF